MRIDLLYYMRNLYYLEIKYTFIKRNSFNEYIINLSIKHKLLEKNKDYYAEYFLLKLLASSKN